MKFLHNLYFRYFTRRLSREIKELYLANAILDFAQGSISIFIPIYLYNLGFSLPKIVLFFFTVYFINFFLIPLGGKIARYKGYEHSILYSTPFLVIFYLSLFAIPYHNLFIISAVFSFALHKSLFWPAYHADFARFGHNEERGREISNHSFLLSLVAIIAPLFGGIVINWLGFKILFLIVSFLILLSNLPLLTTKELFTPIPFSSKDAFSRLFRKKYRRRFFAYLGYGEEFVSLILWPLFIYLIIKDYFSLGALIASASFFSSLLLLYIGKASDHSLHKHPLLWTGTFLTFLAHLSRLLVIGPFSFLLIDIFHKSARNLAGIPLMSITYAKAQQTSVMKSIVFFQMALILGYVLVAIISFLLLIFFDPGWPAIFILSALFSLLYALL